MCGTVLVWVKSTRHPPRRETHTTQLTGSVTVRATRREPSSSAARGTFRDCDPTRRCGPDRPTTRDAREWSVSALDEPPAPHDSCIPHGLTAQSPPPRGVAAPQSRHAVRLSPLEPRLQQQLASARPFGARRAASASSTLVSRPTPRRVMPRPRLHGALRAEIC
jgi:hypothetical protein